MPKLNLRNLTIVLLGLTVIATACLAYISRETQDISDSVLRLHIVANSDSEADQTLKLQVRDEVIQKCSPIFSTCKNARESQAAAADNIGFITETANRVIAENGFGYTASCSVGRCCFPTKRYESAADGTISLPKGGYTALNIRLGSGEGHNWWCVMYPPLCFVDGVASVSEDSADKLKSTLSKSEYELITESTKPEVKIKFKIAEMLGAYSE